MPGVARPCGRYLRWLSSALARAWSSGTPRSIQLCAKPSLARASHSVNSLPVMGLTSTPSGRAGGSAASSLTMFRLRSP